MAVRANVIEVEPGWEIAYQWWPADTKPINERPIVFLNGLGDTYDAWTPFMQKFANRNRLQVDLRGQGRSLEQKLANDPQATFRVNVETQTSDLKKLLEHLKIDDIDLAAFSYGGAIAFDFASREPDRVKRLALIVPYILRLDKSFPLQRMWSWQWTMTRQLGLIPSSLGDKVEHAYETFLTAYMNQRYDHRMGDTHRKRAAIDLTHGIMQFNAFDILEQLPEKSVFLLSGDCDTLVPRSLYTEFWRKLPESKKGHWTRIPDGEHLLLEQKPDVVHAWLEKVLQEE